jgi:hypothetical protein
MNTSYSDLHWFRSSFLAAGLVIVAGWTLGCTGQAPGPDKPRSDVVVTITSGGTPVTEGRVDLQNEQTGEGGGAELDSNGVANIPGVALGVYTVTVMPPPPSPVPPPPGAAPEPAKVYPNIPETVRRAATSPLKAVVKDEGNEFKFDLKQP